MMTLMRESAVCENETTSELERRRGLRINQARPIKVFEPTSSRYYGGQTEDISATGLRVELPRSVALSAGNILSVHVGLSTTGESLANRRQMIPARVVWVRRYNNGPKTRLTAGLEFLANITAHLDAA